MRVRALQTTALIIGALGAMAAIGLADVHTVASGGDPHRVTARRLRSELAASGVDIRYVQLTREAVTTVAGVASFGLAQPVAFEYQVFGSSDEATIRGLGKLNAADFGWREEYPRRVFEAELRGVLGNVALAEYDLTGGGPKRYTTKIAHRTQLDEQRIYRALDDVIFRSFPTTDPYAHALSSSP